jgi:hypothetical protein
MVFTFKSRRTIVEEEGGSSAWRLDPTRARRQPYVLCTRSRDDRLEPDSVEEPGSAFVVGKLSDVVPALDRPGRYLLQFSEYAEVSIPNTWNGARNPVQYVNLADLGIDPATLNWHPMPEAPAWVDRVAPPADAAAVITEAKASIAAALHLPVSMIQVHIAA